MAAKPTDVHCKMSKYARLGLDLKNKNMYNIKNVNSLIDKVFSKSAQCTKAV